MGHPHLTGVFRGQLPLSSETEPSAGNWRGAWLPGLLAGSALSGDPQSIPARAPEPTPLQGEQHVGLQPRSPGQSK